MSDTTALINQIRARERYFAYSIPLTVIPALATVPVSLLIGAEAFEVYIITGLTAFPLTLNISFREQGGEDWNNLPIQWNNMVGTALQPFWLPITRLIEPRKTLTITLTDIGAGNVTTLTLHGGKIL